MSLSERIISALRARIQSGETYAQISTRSGISGAQIHRLANHMADPLKMSLTTFVALFPRATIELDSGSGDAPVAAFDLSDYVPKSEYSALRDQYQDLRDQYQDLREAYLDLKSASVSDVPPPAPAGSGAGAVRPARRMSSSSPSSK